MVWNAGSIRGSDEVPVISSGGEMGALLYGISIRDVIANKNQALVKQTAVEL